MSSPGDGSIFVDLDGFFPRPVQQAGSPRFGTTDSASAKSAPSRVEVSIVHYLLRSAVTLRSDGGEAAWAYFKSFSRECADRAEHFARDWERAPQPDWLRGFREALKKSPQVDSSAMDDIDFSFVLSPKIQAFSFPGERRIEISAVTPVHLRTINLLLWVLSMEIRRWLQILESESPAGRRMGLERYSAAWYLAEDCVDILLPHLFSLYFADVNYSGLPVPRAPSAEIFTRARRCALAQMHFMLAHECAHLLLHKSRKPDPSLEREADAFAYTVLLGEGELWKNDQAQFYTANRWFFLYLALDRIIGAVLSGYEIDWVDLPIRDRELPPEHLSPDMRFPSNEERDCQVIGDLILFRAKVRLHERGVDWIRSMAREFRTRHCFSS